DRAHGPAGAARAAARGDRAVATRRQAPRDDRGRRIVPLGVPGRRERGSVSSPRGRADRLAAGGGDGERGAVPARDDRDGERAAAGTAVTRPGSGQRETGGVSLWRRLVQVVRQSSGANATEAERILLEADFGVEATQQILAAVSGATEGDFRAAVERAVTEALVADGLGDPGALARAATPPTVILVFGVNGVGKTTTVAKLAARLARDGRSGLLAAAD